jgi:hypothetical protein
MKRILPYIPLCVITGLLIYCIYIVSTSNIAFSYEHYIGLSLVLASWCLWSWGFLNRLACFLALLLGTFGQAAFTPVINRYIFGFSIEGKGLDIVIQPYCLLLLILFITLNRNFIKNAIKRFLL